MPNETKRIAVRPNQGTNLQKFVDGAREDNVSVSALIHTMADVYERATRKARKATS